MFYKLQLLKNNFYHKDLIRILQFYLSIFNSKYQVSTMLKVENKFYIKLKSNSDFTISLSSKIVLQYTFYVSFFQHSWTRLAQSKKIKIEKHFFHDKFLLFSIWKTFYSNMSDLKNIDFLRFWTEILFRI